MIIKMQAETHQIKNRKDRKGRKEGFWSEIGSLVPDLFYETTYNKGKPYGYYKICNIDGILDEGFCKKGIVFGESIIYLTKINETISKL